MEPNTGVEDSTDWLTTSIPLLAPFENSLRCQVCKDLFNTPMITSCEHTFCSLCIRRSLDSDGRCPTCRAQDQPSKLRKNGTVQNIVDLFQDARSQTLDVARQHRAMNEERADSVAQNAGSRRKRKWADVNGAEELQGSQKSARQTRSQSRRHAEPVLSQDAITVESDSDDDYAPQKEASASKEPEDGLVACPVCSGRMKEEAVWTHMDKCDGTPPKPQQASKSLTPLERPPSRPSSRPPLPAHNIERLPQPNFRLLKDTTLKKKMNDFGVPTWGDRLLLQRRYTEWVNLYNANADSSRPRNTRELLRDLDTWERSQGGRASQREAKTKDKDFDGQAWARDNKDQFADLIAQARAKRQAAMINDKAGDAKDGETKSMEVNAEQPSADPHMIDLHALPAVRSEGSVVVKHTPGTLTASADPTVVHTSQERTKELSSDAGPLTSAQVRKTGDDDATDLERTQEISQKSQSEPALQLSIVSQQLSQSPVQKKPMFTLPETTFTDGNGIPGAQ